MYSDYWLGGIGVGFVVFGIIFYLATIALMLWLGYLIVRTAVTNGILRADEQRAARGTGPRPGGPQPPYGGPQPPHGGPQPPYGGQPLQPPDGGLPPQAPEPH